jgi:L-alanine-DL-glutamate epimerase-like enolase superfamily enzyme
VREAVGDDARIMVDANERLDLPTALWTGARLADLGGYWLEEPLPSDDVTGHATLAAAVAPPVAVGEHLHGRFEFAAYLHARAASVLQPDVPLTGGVAE